MSLGSFKHRETSKAIGSTNLSEEQKENEKREERGASGVGANASAGRKTRAPEHRSKSDLKLFESRDGRERRGKRREQKSPSCKNSSGLTYFIYILYVWDILVYNCLNNISVTGNTATAQRTALARVTASAMAMASVMGMATATLMVMEKLTEKR